MKLLLTGNPGVGKTTLIRAIAERLEGIRCRGFYTEETRQGRQRSGFRVVTLDGRTGTLASVGSQGPKVGKYSIHVEEFEKVVLPLLDPVAMGVDLYVIDEIGKMELLSRQFRIRISELLARPINVLATIAKRSDGSIDEIKHRSDVEIVEVTRRNRDALPDQIACKIRRLID